MDNDNKKQPVPGHKGAKLTPQQWNELILLWKEGNTTLAELKKRFGVAVPTMQEKFKRLGVKKGELARKQAAAAEAALTLEPAEHAKRVFETKNDTYRLVQMLRATIWKEFATARAEGRKIGTMVNDIRAVRDAATAIKVCREQAYRVLGITEEDVADQKLPDLTIRGLTPDEISDMQAEPIEDLENVMEVAPELPDGDADPS